MIKRIQFDDHWIELPGCNYTDTGPHFDSMIVDLNYENQTVMDRCAYCGQWAPEFDSCPHCGAPYMPVKP